MEQSTSAGAGAGKSTHLPVVESSQVVEGRSYLTQREEKEEAPTRNPASHRQRAKVPHGLTRGDPIPHRLTCLTLLCLSRRGRTKYVPAAVIPSHRHQFPTALFLARPLPLPAPSPIAIPSSSYPIFCLSRSHHSSCCVPFLSSNPISRQPPSQPVPEVNGLRQPLAAVSRPLRGNPSPHTGTVEPYRIPDDKTNIRHRPRVASRGTIPRRLGAPTDRLFPPPRPSYLSGGPQPLAEAPL